MNKNLKLGIVLVIIVVAVMMLQRPSYETTFVENQNVDVASIEEKAELYPRAPELAGIQGYINTPEGTQISDFENKVVLIDFWTYTCINCIRTLPHLVEWDNKYRDAGLVIIGVHTPEFKFEEEYENVLAAVEKYNIEYPVVQDNDYATWRAYKNRYWPHKFLIDKDGFVRYDRIGEGGYQETESIIQELLRELGEEIDVELSNVQDNTPRVRQTPELYAGYEFNLPRGQNLGNEIGLQPRASYVYELPAILKEDVVYLEGRWTSGSEELVAGENASINLNFVANAVNLVITNDNMDFQSGSEVLVYVDGAPSNGDHVNNGVLKINESDLYNLYRGEYMRGIIRINVPEGFSWYAFTFG